MSSGFGQRTLNSKSAVDFRRTTYSAGSREDQHKKFLSIADDDNIASDSESEIKLNTKTIKMQ